MSTVLTQYFPLSTFNCYFEANSKSPLIVSPSSENNVDIIDWAKQNQTDIAKAIHEYGAIVFSGFNLSKDCFPTAFEAVTGMNPESYKGSTPRKLIGKNTYESTAVASGFGG